MKRYPYSYRQTVYTESQLYSLVTIGRKLVAPGDRASAIQWDGKFQSATWATASLVPMMVQCWAFYVPNRICFADQDDWIDFVAEQDGSASIPTTTSQFSGVMDIGQSGVNFSCLPRRAYKLIYNHYFGDEQDAGSNYYTDPFDDAGTNTLGRLLGWDQYRAASRPSIVYSDETFSTAGDVIALDAFAKAMQVRRHNRRVQATGDKYVDIMKLNGVTLDWKIQNAPEYLGSSQKVMFAREKTATDSANLQVDAMDWSGKLNLRITKRNAFAEHGMVIVVAGFRPAFMLNVEDPMASTVYKNDFFSADQVAGPSIPDVDTDGAFAGKFVKYVKGRNIVVRNTSGRAFLYDWQLPDPDEDPRQVWYPTLANFPQPIDSTIPISMMGNFSVRGLSQVRLGV